MVKITSWKLWVKIDVQLMELGNKRYVFPKNGFASIAGKVVLGKEKCERMSRVVKMVGGGGDKDGRRSILILGAQTQGHPRHPPLVGTHGTHQAPDLGRHSSCRSFFSEGFGFTFFLGLSILILADLPLGHAWKKDMFWNYLKTNS